MANQEHRKILGRGIDYWNQWRAENPDVEPDLSGITFSAEILVGANFSNTNFLEATIVSSEAALVDFSGAFLKDVNFSETALQQTSLKKAILTWTNFSHAKLDEADFSGAVLGWTTFGDNDLSRVKGLKTVDCMGPSILGIETIYRSSGNIPEVFLRGCGVPESFIVQIPSL